MKRSFLVWLLTMALVATAWFKVFIISSMWNKMEYQNMFCSGDNLDLKYTFNPSEVRAGGTGKGGGQDESRGEGVDYQNMFCSGDNLDLKYTVSPSEVRAGVGAGG